MNIWNSLYTKVCSIVPLPIPYPATPPSVTTPDLYSFPRHTTFRSRVNATPVENSIIAVTIYARPDSRMTCGALLVEMKASIIILVPLCASPMARGMYVAERGWFP